MKFLILILLASCNERARQADVKVMFERYVKLQSKEDQMTLYKCAANKVGPYRFYSCIDEFEESKTKLAQP